MESVYEAAGGGKGLVRLAEVSERYGNEMAVVRIRSGNGPHEEKDQRVIGCFDQGLEDVGLTGTVLRWSWDGVIG